MSCSCEIDILEENDQYHETDHQQYKEDVKKKYSELYSFIDFFFKTMDTGDLVYLTIDIIQGNNKIATHIHRGYKTNSIYHIVHSLDATSSCTSNVNYTIKKYNR